MNSLFEKITRFVNQHDLLRKGDSILVSVSAGKDSVFLLNYFMHIRDEMNLKLNAFHLNHLTRNGDSDEDMKFIMNLCRDYGIEIFTESFDFSTISENFENAARKKRYSLLEEMQTRHGIDKIATAHTLSDDIETVLYRIFRGTSVHGLQGISPKRERLIRPLLSVTKEEILDYLEKTSVKWREDSSNLDNNYDRNYIRNFLIPEIEQRFSLNSSIMNLKQSAIESANIIRSRIAGTLDIIKHEKHVQIEFSKNFNERAFFNFIISEIIREFMKTDVTNSMLNESYRNMISASGKSNQVLYSGNAICIMKKYIKGKLFLIISSEKPAAAEYWELLIETDGVLPFESETSAWKITVKLADYACFSRQKDSSVLFLNGDETVILKLRQKKDGDRMITGGLEVKLKKLMINSKLDAESKLLLPVAESDGIIAGVMLSAVSSSANRVSDIFKVNSNTKKILAIYCDSKIM